MAYADDDWTLLGAPGDETRLFVHPALGYSVPIVGHPSTLEPPDGPPFYDAVVTSLDGKLQLGMRVDTVRGTTADEQAMMTSLAAVRMKDRADDQHVLPERTRVIGARASNAWIYPLRDDPGVIEQLVVAVQKFEHHTRTVYQTIRFATAELDVVQWANIRTALAGHHHWDPDAVREVAPRMWPATSTLAALDARLALSDSAWADARAKRSELATISDPDFDLVIERIVATADNPLPPTSERHTELLQFLDDQMRMRAPRQEEILMRNADQIRSVHDLRAWCWQSLWVAGWSREWTTKHHTRSRTG